MNYKNPLFLLVVVVIVVGAYIVLTMPDRRSLGDKVSDAVHDLPNDTTKAGRDLESRTPGQKIGDAIKDNTAPRDQGN